MYEYDTVKGFVLMYKIVGNEGLFFKKLLLLK